MCYDDDRETRDASDAAQPVSTSYNLRQGLAESITDPCGIVGATFYNLLGETTKTISDYTDGTPTNDTNQTTTFAYDGDGNEISQTAVMPAGTANQTTAWVYGISTTTGSTIDSNSLLYKEVFPSASTGDATDTPADEVTYDDDNLGETIGMQDQNSTVHAYGFDVLGRDISDAVTIPSGSAVDGSVHLHTVRYDSQGNAYLMSSYASTSGGTPANQVEDIFNGLGQLTNEYQSASGAVNTETTPETQYAYNDPTSGSLMTAETYPNGRVLEYGRDDNALDSAVGRVDYLADAAGSGAGHLVDYEYMGVNTMVQQADANGVKLTYLQQSGDSHAITSGPQYAGDNVTGIDRFGRVDDQNWVNTTTPTPTTNDRFQYAYDQNSNVLYSDNLVNPSESALYHASGSGNGYDPLNRLTNFERGTLSASGGTGTTIDTVSSPCGAFSGVDSRLLTNIVLLP